MLLIMAHTRAGTRHTAITITIIQQRRTVTDLPLTLVQPIRYAVEHGRRTRVRDPDHSAVPVTVNLVVQIVFVHEHQPTARRRPLGFLYVNLLAIVHRFGGGHERYAISVENGKKKKPHY